MDRDPFHARVHLPDLLLTLERGTYLVWGVRYTTHTGTHVHLSWDDRYHTSTRAMAEHDAAELLLHRGIHGTVVHRTVEVTGWIPEDTWEHARAA